MTAPASRPLALALVRHGEHVLAVGLVAVGVWRSLAGGSDDGLLVLGAAGALLGWYAAGQVLLRTLGTGGTRVWLAVLTLAWVALVWVSSDFLWLVLVLFLLYLRLLPVRWAVAGVLLLAATGVMAVSVAQGEVTAPVVLGPLIGAGVATLITVVNRDLRDQVERGERLLAELADAQAHRAAAERHAGVLEERERLAAEIHDTVGQSLTSILLLLRTLRERHSDLPDDAVERLLVAEQTAQQSLDETRRLVRAMTPGDLAGQGLPQALQRLVDRTTPAGVDAHFRVDGEPCEVPTPQAVALLRAAQGSIGNVLRHAGARTLHLTLTFQPEQVRLDVVDDGRGFEPGADPGGTGLAVLARRLHDVGGSLEVESGPGRGTAVGATVPLGGTP